nr:hypothetical protein [Tanacetum cinerariifolium]
MAALVISISSDESTGCSSSWVILIGSIHIEVHMALEVAAAITLHAGVLELDTHSSSDLDPSESSPPPVPVAPMVLPFLHSDDSESDTEFPKRHVSFVPHDGGAELHHDHLHHPNHHHLPLLPQRFLLLPFYQHHLLISSHLLMHHLEFVVDELFSFDMGRTFLEAYRRWRYAPLSTMYPLTTSESLAGDFSPKSSARPSRKRCRPPTATVTSPIPTSKALVPTRADLLPPRKRFRDSISPEDSIEEEIKADVLADIEVDIAAEEAATGMDVEARIDAGIGIEADDRVDREYEVESSARGTVEIRMDRVIGPTVTDDDAEPTREDYPDMEIPVDRIADIKVGQRQLEADSMIAMGDRAGLLDRVASLERGNVRLRGTLRMETARADREIGGFCREAVGLSSMMRCMDLGRVVELASGSEINVNQ